jgi:hypothetical protein
MLAAYKLQSTHQITFSLPEMEKQPDLVRIKDTFKKEFGYLTVEGNLKNKTLTVTFPKSQDFQSTKDDILSRLQKLGHNSALVQSEHEHKENVKSDTPATSMTTKKVNKRH